jgi:hypothetical protein
VKYLTCQLFYCEFLLYNMPGPETRGSANKDAGSGASVGSFEKDMKEAGFTEKTIKILREHEFNSVDSVSLLNGQDEVVGKLDISIQQRLLLLKMAKSHPVDNPGTGATAAAAGIGQPLHQVLGGLLHGAGGPESHQTDEGEFGGVMDPQIYLKGGCGAKSKFLDILDFINMVPPLAEEQVFCEDKGVQMVFTTKKPPIESVSTEEWCLGL